MSTKLRIVLGRFTVIMLAAHFGSYWRIFHRAGDIYGSTFVEIIGTVNPDRCQLTSKDAPLAALTPRIYRVCTPHVFVVHARLADLFKKSRTLLSKRTLTWRRQENFPPFLHCFLILAFRLQYNEAVLMANGKFKALFAQ